MEQIEEMRSFFTKRAAIYDEHMRSDVPGCAEGYVKMAKLLPSGIKTLLDLGCGTGLELEEIFRRFPSLSVTGIDLTPAMLDICKKKFVDKDLTLVNASYFDCDFGVNKFNAAVSFQTMHHFSHEQKIGLYKKVFTALSAGGVYVECDYMVTARETEEFYYQENARLCKEQGVPGGVFIIMTPPARWRTKLLCWRTPAFRRCARCGAKKTPQCWFAKSYKSNGRNTMYDLTSKQTIFYLSKKYGFANKKSLGQNFLLDPGVLAEITNAAGDGGILEIGPGIGTLTGALCQKAKKVVSVEVDQSLEPVLTETMAGYSNWKLVFGDVLKVNLPKLLEEEFAGLPVSVAANLPYYITTPILTMLLESHLPFKSIVVMVQKEVANRILAQSGGKDYGALTVFLNYYTEASLVCEVPKESFFPAPEGGFGGGEAGAFKKAPGGRGGKRLFPPGARPRFPSGAKPW